MAIEVDLEYFSNAFPELAPTEAEEDAFEDRLEVLNTIAALFVDDDQWGDSAEYAKALVIAHKIAKEKDSHLLTGGGAVTSKKEGDVSVSYATPNSSNLNEFETTNYGRQFLELRSTAIMPLGFYS